MNKIQSIIAYLCNEYPHKSEITKARLTKMVYLADWFSALLKGKQLTDINWVFNHYGPYVDDVVEAAQTNYGFKIETESTPYGTPKYIISFHGNSENIDLTNDDKEILQKVIEKTRSLYFNDFVDYVYSTYPVKTNERYSTFNLEQLAQQYKAQQHILN
ncbi:Panacea domain-containing protein [Thiomicrorhabdus sp.]|uniref:Panacea domain-containing protein n=1 Tax=Thiomicrorhabdus sp. TaxID=2039724 RepID=UPI0029C719E5|nr:Panacea domain-containing protein [Thiomicrorhabdus sp.]